MKPIKFENLTLSELKELKSIIEVDLSRKLAIVNQVRGYDYSELCRREYKYERDPNHKKLEKINKRIREYLDSIVV